jgi:hypothetical protein
MARVLDLQGVKGMALVQGVRENILKSLKKAELAIEKGDFSDLMTTGIRISVLPELITDEKWKKELYLSALVMTNIGGFGDKEFLEKLAPEKKTVLIKDLGPKLLALEDAISGEKIGQMSDVLRDMVMLYYLQMVYA